MKIKMKEARSILGLKKSFRHTWLFDAQIYYSQDKYYIHCKIHLKWLPYLLSFIPLSIISLFYYMWEDGLRAYEWPSRLVGYYNFFYDETRYKCFKNYLDG